MNIQLPLGPVMADLKGVEIDSSELDVLRHPDIGGVILFARNFESPEQLRALTASIRAIREPQLLIAVDHEGGRVQRFQQGFTRIPPMALLGLIHQAGGPAVKLAEALGCIIAAELVEHGLDFSFTPVLDLDYGSSSVIGDRAFSADPRVVTSLAQALVQGLNTGGVAGVGKHFPGHGYVRADSHLEVPVDERSLEALENDIAPYRTLARSVLSGIMPAHVIYSRVDSKPAGFSSRWLRGMLRGELGYQGMIFSDDLSMEGASIAGGVQERAMAAFEAGCDMVLVCNAPESTERLLDAKLNVRLDSQRAMAMRAKFKVPDKTRYAAAVATLHAAAIDHPDIMGSVG
jgi:beta-N-acetylhexosaminidase